MSKFKAALRITAALTLTGSLWAGTYLTGADEITESLQRAQVLGSALMIGAHPDDENTAVLAWLARGRHIRTGYLSLTRGEGGQNLIGSEQGDALGVIRTQELLDARNIDGAEQFFTRAVDFGFCKSSREAIAKWGHDQTLSDIVWVIRRFQPDVIILRFSGTPLDGHGHHQASAILGKEAFEAAGDPARFPEQLTWVKPWKAKRLVWNAFTFTPEMEKRTLALPNRIQVDAGAFDPVIGKSYGEIAGLSRSQHRSQGMGVPQQRGPSMNYFVPVEGDMAKQDLFDGIDISWNRLEGGKTVGDSMARAVKEFTPEHPEKILPALADARRKLSALSGASSDSGWAHEKLSAIDHLLELCSGLWVDAASDAASVSPGGSLKVTVTAIRRLPADVRWKTFSLDGLSKDEHQTVSAALGDDAPVTREVKVDVPAAAPFSQPFWLVEPRHSDRYVITDQRLIGRAAPIPVLNAGLELEIAGAPVHLDCPVHFRYVDHVRGELTRPLEIVPAVAVNLPERVVIFPSGEERRISVQVRANSAPISGDVQLEVPPGWTAASAGSTFQLDSAGSQTEFWYTVKPPAGAGDVRASFQAVAHVGGREIATGMQSIDYEHIPPQVIFLPAQGTLQPEKLRVLARNIGYIMGAGDAVPDAIRQMGGAVTLLSQDDLLRSDLSRFDAIVTGVRAYNVRDDLKAAEPRLLAYVQAGGTLVVQYNVLDFARFPDKTVQPGPLGPYPLELSRDRVVEEDSPITLTEPRSPLLNSPNTIGPADFQNWVQERGLYFAFKWDPHYATLFATHDAGEKDLDGGNLYTRYGKGVYVFTAYSWFRELPAGVPGAYRIFANLLSAGKTLASTAPTPQSIGSSGH